METISVGGPVVYEPGRVPRDRAGVGGGLVALSCFRLRATL
jgi:hypothetical protein